MRGFQSVPDGASESGILAESSRGLRSELPLTHHAGRGAWVRRGMRVQAFNGTGSYREIGRDRGAAQLDKAVGGGAFKVADSKDRLRRVVKVNVHTRPLTTSL